MEGLVPIRQAISRDTLSPKARVVIGLFLMAASAGLVAETYEKVYKPKHMK